MERMSQMTVKLLISPFLYLICLGPTVVGAIVIFSATEYGGVLYRYAEPVYGYDDVVPGVDGIALATIFLIVGLAFGSLGWALILLERLARPKLIDHLRRCACLYVCLAILSALQIPEYAKANQLPGYPVPEFQDQVLWLVIACAILVDAFLLLGQRVRYGRASLEGVS